MSGWDFAQVKTRSPDGSPPAPQRTKALLLVVVSLALLAGAFAIGFWLGQARSKQADTGEDRARLEQQLKKQQQELAKLRQSAGKKQEPAATTTQVGELTFYNELPHQAVVPAPMKPKDAPAPAPAPAAVAKPDVSGTTSMQDLLARELRKKPTLSEPAQTTAPAGKGRYLLQVGSFQRRQDAESFAGRFRGVGMVPMIRTAELAGRGTWYRVFVGPFVSQADVEKARAQVQSTLKIKGLIVKGG